MATGILMGTGAMDRKEVFSWYTKISPRTPLEEKHIDDLSAIDLQIFYNKVNMIAYLGKETMVKVGTSPGMTGTDLNCGIYTASGDIAVSGIGVYLHAVSGQGAIKYWKNCFAGSMGFKDGDLFYVTDPYLGGTHVNDQFLVSPIFTEGELVAWVSSGCHQADVGAIDIGMSASSKNRFCDGMNLTTIKIAEDFKIKEDITVALANMTRDPHSWILDLKARYASVMAMRDELKSLGKAKGAGYIAGGLRRLIEDTGVAVKKKISQYPDGTYRSVVFLDSTGIDTFLTRIVCKVVKKGDSFTIDFTGTSPQVPGPLNSYSFCVPGGMVMILMPYFFHDLPTSLGVFAPVTDFIVPENSQINPSVDAAVSLGVSITFTLGVAFLQVMNKMAFSTIDGRLACSATQGGTGDVPQWVVQNQRGLWIAGFGMDVNATGQGGRVNKDGTDSMNPIWAAMADCLDTEWYEKDYPFVYLFRKHAPDSCGFGKNRGGAGMESCWFIHNLKSGAISTIGGGTNAPNAVGVFGGYSSFLGPGLCIWNSNIMKMIDAKQPLPRTRQELVTMVKGNMRLGKKALPTSPLASGDIITTQNSAGGGYGDVLEREPERVMEDLRQGIISEWVVQNVYKVAYDSENLIVDVGKTEKLRVSERASRKARGKKYKDFEKEWMKMRPREEIMKCFGDFRY